MKREPTPEQKEKHRQRREQFRTLCKELAAMPKEQREALAMKMPGIVTCEGHSLSGVNCHLVMLQMPHATVVGGFRQWIRQGRCPAKGSHALGIWVPIGHKAKNEEGETDTDAAGFVMGSVFDISQTEEHKEITP